MARKVKSTPKNPKVIPVIVDGRTMLPVRFVAESIGCDVQWGDKTKTVTITYPEQLMGLKEEDLTLSLE